MIPSQSESAKKRTSVHEDNQKHDSVEDADNASHATSVDEEATSLHDSTATNQIVHHCRDTSASEGSHIFNGDAGPRSVLCGRRHNLVGGKATCYSSILNGDIGIEEYLIVASNLRSTQPQQPAPSSFR